MIIDVHSHAWEYPRHFTDDFRRQASIARAGAEVDLTVRYVADYVAADPKSLIGFLCVDPTQPGWQDELREGHQTLGLRGIKLLPMYAGFRPDDAMLDPLWAYASDHRLPVLLHAGTTFV